MRKTTCKKGICQFQLTHSRGVRLLCDILAALAFNFNSRTHVECDFVYEKSGIVFAISTHALTWSATRPAVVVLVRDDISTHALTWSATSRIVHKYYPFTIFQLTHSRGVRLLTTMRTGVQQ